MADNKKTQTEDLKRLEDQAYFELCQIIAEAMQYQDVELLNARISEWKIKYKKLLDNSPSNSNFKKRIEFLLKQYYSSVTQYILGQLKLKEEKKIENQSKALRKLYSIIKDTNDLDLLKKKVKEWQDKYPIAGFLKMYQKRIECYTRDKNLRENAFKQEEAFRDLVDITKIHGTLDELKYELGLWEQKYSINNKYTIDDFIKHQAEIKRYTSDEFLQSIAREEPTPDNIDKTEIDIVEEYNTKSCSNITLQSTAYTSLLAIASKPNNANELFDWVYKNRYIKFNDKYKELILSATYLNYRPEYLKHLTIPNIDILSKSLSFNEYKNINEIKRYAIISYFNLLLPPDKAISNNYFNRYVQTIYANSQNIKRSEEIDNENILDNNISNSGTKGTISETEETTEPSIEIQIEDIYNNSEIIIDFKAEKVNQFEESDELDPLNVSPIIEEIPEVLTDDDFSSQSTIEEPTIEDSDQYNLYENIEEETIIVEPSEELIKVPNIELTDEPIKDSLKELIEEPSKKTVEEIVEEPIENFTAQPSDNTQTIIDSEQNEFDNKDYEESISFTSNDEPNTESPIQDTSNDEISSKRNLDPETIVAFSPLFFSAINNYNKQSLLVSSIDSTVTQYIESEKTNDISLSKPAKTKTDLE